eukprot:UN03311
MRTQFQNSILKIVSFIILGIYRGCQNYF